MPEEDRIISIETKIAYHEDLVQTLNDTIISQQARISALEERYETLLARLASLDAPSPTDADPDERPPHY